MSPSGTERGATGIHAEPRMLLGQDFARDVMTRAVCRLLPAPATCAAVEIDPGDGRRLLAAAAAFGTVLALESAGRRLALEQMLSGHGVAVLERHGTTLPLEAESVDFVYTVSALSSCETFEHCARLLREIHRVLRPGGVAHLHHAGFAALPWGVRLRCLMQGHCEFETAPGEQLLALRGATVRGLGLDVGFEIADSRSAHTPGWRLVTLHRRLMANRLPLVASARLTPAAP